MARPRIDKFWVQQVFMIAANTPKPARVIEGELEKIGKQLARTSADWPSERQIRRYLKEYQSMSEPERRRYREFRWPEAMLIGELPWEAAPVTLELLKYLHQNGQPRPLLPVAKWFWRATLAAPDASIEDRFEAARQLASQEAIGNLEVCLTTGGVEWFLAYTPWRSPEDLAAYESKLVGDDQARSASQDIWRAEPVPRFLNRGVAVGPNTPVDTLKTAMDAQTGYEIPGGHGSIAETLVEARKKREKDNG